MRPRKKCILYCADELRLSTVGFAIDQRLLRVRCGRASHAEDLGALFHADTDVVVLLRDRNEALDRAALSVVEKLSRLHSEARIIDVTAALVAEGRPVVPCVCAHRVLSLMDMTLLAEAMHIACARKRGPKKQIVVVGADLREERTHP